MDPDMQLWRGLYLPKHEKHLIEWMMAKGDLVDGVPAYQFHKLRRAMEYVKHHRIAVDVGAHCGLWSMHLVRAFNMVHAFEPLDLHRRCFVLNVAPPYVLYERALGDLEGGVNIHTENTSSGDSYVSGEGTIRISSFDSIAELSESPVDFVKLDCEGYEYFALVGAKEMLQRCKPCILVEQKPGKAQKFGLKETQAVSYLQSLGAVLRFQMSGDFCLSWD